MKALVVCTNRVLALAGAWAIANFYGLDIETDVICCWKKSERDWDSITAEQLRARQVFVVGLGDFPQYLPHQAAFMERATRLAASVTAYPIYECFLEQIRTTLIGAELNKMPPLWKPLEEFQINKAADDKNVLRDPWRWDQIVLGVYSTKLSMRNMKQLMSLTEHGLKSVEQDGKTVHQFLANRNL